MRSIVLINRLILGSIIMASACVGDSVDDGPVIGPTEGEHLAADEVGLEEEPHEITRDQLDANGQVKTETLSCGLSILVFSDYTDYWIRNCFELGIRAQVVTLFEDVLYLGDEQAVLSFSTVSGSVRGRVLRLRRR